MQIMKKKIRIKFVDFWKNFDPANNFIYHILSAHYYVNLTDEPEYCFFSVFGYEHLKYNHCVKILYTGENMVPDFNLCDYALGFHFIDFGDRYMRFPLYVRGNGFNGLKIEKKIDNSLANRKFCNFVYSNNINADPLRDYFFEELSKYKRVDSGGRHKNNIGGPVVDKVSFIKDYKFTISFENSTTLGYTTEKIVQPMQVSSIPIYYGNPKVDRDFNPDSFIWVKDKGQIKDVVSEVIRLDQDKQIYLEKLKEPWFKVKQIQKNWDNDLLKFLENIFEKSIREAKYIPRYGFTGHYLKTQITMNSACKKKTKYKRIKMKIKNLIRL